MNKSGYMLKGGVAFRFEGTIYDNANLTKKAAEWYLKQNPLHEKHFIEIPETKKEEKG